jgi:acetylornithine deacetylase/succinyl-diaminopimelate desuccinylase-like protein
VTDDPLREYAQTNQDRFLRELEEYLSIPSISTDPDQSHEIERCANWLADHLRDIGINKTEVHKTDGHPIVYAEHVTQPDQPTILIYAHYDVQPPDPVDEWDSPPFEPTIRDDKIFARGATDDKGQFFAHVKGLETHLAENDELPVNVKLVVEGEEEVGSIHIEDWVAEHKEKLDCDAVLISDSAMFGPGLPTITYGLRGLTYFEVSVRGPSHDLHSGLYGGAVPNPINVLSKMIGQLHDDEGRIAIPGFYDDVEPLSDEERETLAELPFEDSDFIEETGVPGVSGEEGYSTLERRWTRPSLDCNGIWGGYTDPGAKTVLPAEAHAKISCRLVPDQDPDEIADLAEDYIHEIAPDCVEVEFNRHHGGYPVVSDLDNPTVEAACDALERSWGREAVFTRGGGTIPVCSTFDRVLDVPTVLMGFGLNDDRLHSPNEKFNLENFYKGIETSVYLWDELAD